MTTLSEMSEMSEMSGTMQAPRDRTASRGLVWHAIVVVLVLLVLYPIFWLVSASFKPAEDVLTDLSIWPKHATSANYSEAMGGVGGYNVGRYFSNSPILSLGRPIRNILPSSH